MTAPDTTAIRAQMEALDGHTPGPWDTETGLPYNTMPRVSGADGSLICECGNVSTDQDQWESDARLIAAAPDMRETILALCDALDAAQTSACPRGEDCDMTLAYMVGRGRKDDDMAVLRAENERLRNFIVDFSETKFDRIDRRAPDPQDDLDPLTDYLAIEAWQEDARATLAQEGGE